MKNLRIASPLLWLLLSLFIIQSKLITAQKIHEGKTILAVFAHPDDESTIAPMLVKYSREGAAVHLVIVTDGRYGTNDFHDHVAGEKLVDTRKEEMKCAASQLGVNLIHLDYHDQLRAGEGYDGHVPHARAMIKDLFGIMERIQPDVVITWGPDGGSTHMDHRLVGASITQVYLSKEWEKPIALFYYGTPAESIDNPENRILRGQASKYLRTKISYTNEDLDIAYESYKCHYSQIDPNMTEDDFKNRSIEKGMLVYLRKFEAPMTDTNSIFE